MALVAVAFAVLLGMTALVVDVGYAYYTKRALQASADAAALAGAQELPDPRAAAGRASEYSGSPGGKNARDGIPAVTSASTACREDGVPCRPANAVVVKETADVRTKFARILGLDTLTVSARAVAVVFPGNIPWAIFAYDSDCLGLGFKYERHDMVVEGGIHSNGGFTVEGNDISAAFASSGGPSDCPAKVEGTNIDFGGSAMPVADTAFMDWPAFFTPSEFPCTYTATDFVFGPSPQTIPPGVYCATRLFKVSGDHVTGNITVLAPAIKIEGSNHSFAPFAKNVLFFATGTGTLKIEGTFHTWSGIIFDPMGTVKIQGDSTSISSGLIEAVDVDIQVTNFHMVGSGPGTADKVIALVE